MTIATRGVLICCAAAISYQTAALAGTGNTQPANDVQNSCRRLSAGERAVSLKELVPNILCDQKLIWTFPLRLGRGEDLVPTIAIGGTVAGLIAIDQTDTGYFRRTNEFGGFNKIFSSRNTALATVLVPSAFYVTSLIRHDSYGQNTSLLVGEAVADSEIVSTVLKEATQRLRPADIRPHGNFADSWTEGKGWTASGGFPSGHEIAAFSVATIFARRYTTHRWVPYVAYGAAALVGLSRITTSAHFPSDVFVGAALGYAISRFTVLQ